VFGHFPSQILDLLTAGSASTNSRCQDDDANQPDQAGSDTCQEYPPDWQIDVATKDVKNQRIAAYDENHDQKGDHDGHHE
jgi:hypothetical protein